MVRVISSLACRTERAMTAKIACLCLSLLLPFQVFAESKPANNPAPPGAEKTAKTKILETGARLMQSNSPVASLDIYLNGFHADKRDAEHQMESHHFCRQVNQDFAQCVLFDGNTQEANLQGIEYIISETIYDGLPADEKKYWHPHNYEILSGTLIAPNIPELAEKQLMRDKMNSYGKTWHVWRTGMFGMPSDKLPLGDPALMWSFNRDGEAKPGLVEQRDRRLKVDSEKERQARAELTKLARPQGGVDDMARAFKRPTKPLPGVVDNKADGVK